jgi:hypothetical protein
MTLTSTERLEELRRRQAGPGRRASFSPTAAPRRLVGRAISGFSALTCCYAAMHVFPTPVLLRRETKAAFVFTDPPSSAPIDGLTRIRHRSFRRLTHS